MGNMHAFLAAHVLTHRPRPIFGSTRQVQPSRRRATQLPQLLVLRECPVRLCRRHRRRPSRQAGLIPAAEMSCNAAVPERQCAQRTSVRVLTLAGQATACRAYDSASWCSRERGTSAAWRFIGASASALAASGLSIRFICYVSMLGSPRLLKQY